MKLFLLLIPLLLSGCASLPTYIEHETNTPSVKLVVDNEFNAPFLGYSTFVDMHTEEETCGDSFKSKSAVRLIVLDKGNPLISDLNRNGVKLATGKKYSFRFIAAAGTTSCSLFASFTPENQHEYKIDVSGVLLGFTAECKAELYSTDINTKVTLPVGFEYYGQCNEQNK